MVEKYKPVSCNLYDELSNAAVLNRAITLTTIDNKEFKGLIKDIYTRNKEEFCIIDNIQLRLDQIAVLEYLDNESILKVSHWSCKIND